MTGSGKRLARLSRSSPLARAGRQPSPIAPAAGSVFELRCLDGPSALKGVETFGAASDKAAIAMASRMRREPCAPDEAHPAVIAAPFALIPVNSSAAARKRIAAGGGRSRAFSYCVRSVFRKKVSF